MKKTYLIIKKVTADNFTQALTAKGDIVEVRQVRFVNDQLQPIVGALDVEVTEEEFENWVGIGFH